MAKKTGRKRSHQRTKPLSCAPDESPPNRAPEAVDHYRKALSLDSTLPRPALLDRME